MVILMGLVDPEISPLQLLNVQSFSGIALISINEPLEYGLDHTDCITYNETDPEPLMFNLKS